MFHVQTELINRSYPQKGIQMYSEIIENGGLLFFAGLNDFEKFFNEFLAFNKKGFEYLIPSKECTPTSLNASTQSSTQITCEFTLPELSKEQILDHIEATYEKVTQHIASLCKWAGECNCIKVKRPNPINLFITLRREEELLKMLASIPVHKK